MSAPDHAHGHGHAHTHGRIDPSIVRSRAGLRAVGLSLAVLLATAAAQTVVFVASGSIALLADLVHNAGDALTAIPLAVAFVLRSAPAEKRAGAVGFIGNELAAFVRLRAGRRLSSPALVADGHHARADGLVSLAVVASALAVWLGLDAADPLIGLAISLVILRITWQSWQTVTADRVARLR